MINKAKDNKVIRYGIYILIILILFGIYDKYKREKIFNDFKKNKKVKCGDTIVQKSAGWRIHHNRFFTNGKELKTIVLCEEYR